LGEDLPASSGVFNLFSPSAEPTCKYMVYELAFAAAGRQYYLAGRKEVREGPVVDMLRDTTTLFTQLHQGTDRTGPVVGAGVLTIDASQLIGLAASMRVTHARSLADEARAALRFGRFFMGELWETYAHL
jgi:hypothetical protein